MGAQAAIRGGRASLPPETTALIVILKKKKIQKTRMNIFHVPFMLFNLNVSGKIVTNLQQIACVK